ncbi:MAG TPA: hypothetical protein VJG90_02000 [Candidatus Nanoarchaeia archaeon]|nr:hypothetical protein [Candidatus Nanoarchaeia archaeon]
MVEKEKIIATNKEEFLKEFMLFYKEFLSGTAGAVKRLANIQSNHKEDYDALKQLQINPDALFSLMGKFDAKKKLILYELIARSATLEGRVRMLFALNKDEQMKLAEDLEMFAKELSEKLKEVSK